MQNLVDAHGRHINYLRLSVTDLCNLRCTYCLPGGSPVTCLSDAELLSSAELEKLVRVLARLGIDKVRLTGGEPLVRRDIVSLVKMIAQTQEIKDLALTTNGLLLAEMASDLKRAGLGRVNVSLDTLDAQSYRRITGADGLDRVWAGIHCAEQVGLLPLKINMVVMKGVNEHEVVDFARLTLTHPWQIRFIEYMPFGDSAADWQQHFYSMAEVQQVIRSVGELVPVGADRSASAKVYRLPGAVGSLGFISPVSEHFCSTCNRLRLTPEGKLRLCLLGDAEIDIRTLLRQDVSDDELAAGIGEALQKKPISHQLDHETPHLKRRMSQIGG